MAGPAQINSDLTVPQTPSNLDEAFMAMGAGMQIDDEELHRLAMQSQGSQEMEYCFGEESSLHNYFKNCQKNPGHENFIVLDELSLDHFPEELRHPEFLDLIHCQAALTVKLTAFFIGIKPESVSLKSFFRTGTGFVILATPMRSWVTEDGKKEEQACLTKPENSCGESADGDVFKLQILTATHTVFRNMEAREVKIEFSYFDDSPTRRKRVKSAKVPLDHSDFGNDFSILTHYTKDKELYLKLKKCIDQLHHEINVTVNPPSEWVPIVSHPHGCEKHVSFGKICSEDSELEHGPVSGPMFPWLDNFSSICYTTGTCPGSSGARVFLWSLQKRLIVFAHRAKRNNTYNVSARGFRYQDLLDWLEIGLRPIKPPVLSKPYN